MWHAAAVFLQRNRGQTTRGAGQGGLRILYGGRACLRRLMASMCGFESVPASLLRGTCAVQKSGGTVRDDPGRSDERCCNGSRDDFSCDGHCWLQHRGRMTRRCASRRVPYRYRAARDIIGADAPFWPLVAVHRPSSARTAGACSCFPGSRRAVQQPRPNSAVWMRHRRRLLSEARNRRRGGSEVGPHWRHLALPPPIHQERLALCPPTHTPA